MLTAIKLMQVMLDKKQPLSKLITPVTIYPQVLKNVRVADKDAAMKSAAVQLALERAVESLGGDGRMLLRKSGTEPVLRVMAEAPTFEQCEACVDAVIDAMARENLVMEDR